MAALLLVPSAPATAQTAQGIAVTRHNLGSTGTNNRASNTDEVCVFCHTPHGGATSTAVPLWNKRLAATGPAGGGSYTTYDTLLLPSLDGTVAPVGSVSMACLSCHDGTQAMDNVINAPGSGGFDANGGSPTPGGGRGWSWTGSTVDTATGRMSNAGDRISMLGTDLSNDHPIGIQYCGGGLSGTGTAVSGSCRDSDFVLPLTQVINSNQVFWVETGGPGKQRTDLPLYQRTTGGLGPLVECGSCHDPHVSSGQSGPAGTGTTSGETFLRVGNGGSAVCRACHVK